MFTNVKSKTKINISGSGNRDVHVRSSPIERGKRLVPLHVPVDEEIESSHLKFLMTPPLGWNFAEAVSRFNANIAYSGLIHAVTQEVKKARSEN